MLKRPQLKASITQALERSRIVCLLGPRQAGKTTLARAFLPFGHANYFDLEYPPSLQRLDNPLLALESLKGLVVIDEVQRMPSLFPLLRVLADREDQPATFLLLGSASPDLLHGASESLAGRVETIEVTPFSTTETGQETLNRLWLRGGYPLSFLADSDTNSFTWRENFIGQFLLKDIPQLGIQISTSNLRRFWNMLAHYHGQTWNGSEIGGSLGVSGHTTRHYLDLLSETYMVRVLPAWHENVGKRQVKAPRIHFRDSGVFHSLMGIENHPSLLQHPKLGASWEGFAIEEILRKLHPREAYFWSVHNGPELDLLCFKDTRRLGFEIKYADAPRLTRSMRTAYDTLHLDQLFVIHPGSDRYPLAPGIQVLPLTDFLSEGVS